MTIGVDVSKDELVYCARTGPPRSVANSTDGVASLLDGLRSDTVIAMEATGRYYRLLADTAHLRGFKVIVHNPKDVRRYANSVSPRATTDPIMAKIIAEFSEIRNHRFYDPVPGFVDELKNLVRTRAGLVKERVSLLARAGEHIDIADYLSQATDAYKQAIGALDEKITAIAKAIPQYGLLIQVPGFGPLIASYLIALLSSGTFARSDSFVAFIGFDLCVRESGKFAGRRKLSKRGDPEARRLLYMAALAACRSQTPFGQLYDRYIERGFTKTEATVIVARKLARTAWAIFKHNQPYHPARVCSQPITKSCTDHHDRAIIYSAPNVVDKRIAKAVVAEARPHIHNNQKRDKPEVRSKPTALALDKTT